MGDDASNKKILPSTKRATHSSRVNPILSCLSDQLSSYDIEDYRRISGNDDERLLNDRPPHWG